MSIEMWTDQNTKKRYPIGTVNWTGSHGPVKDAFEIMMGSVSNKYGLVGALVSKFYNTFSNGAWCPDYGLWGGKNWAGGERLAESGSKKIGWGKEPCYNNSIRQIATNPNLNKDSCISLVDAITKTHDWMYYQAETQYAAGTTERKNAYLAADVMMLQNILAALNTGSYTSQTGIYHEATQTWSPKIYTGKLDSTERAYLTALVPVFLAKIHWQDESDVFQKQADVTALMIEVHLGSFAKYGDPSGKNILLEKNGVMIMQHENTSSSDAVIMGVKSAQFEEPVNVSIGYGKDSTRASNAYAFNGGGGIQITGGSVRTRGTPLKF